MIRIKSKVSGGFASAKTDLEPGTRVFVRVKQEEMINLATDIGAKSAVEEALKESGLTISDPNVLRLLENFAKAVGKASVERSIPEIPVKVSDGGEIAIPVEWPDGFE